MAKLQQVSAAVVVRGVNKFSVSVSLPKTLRDRFSYVQPKGSFLTGFTLYACERESFGARKITRRDSAHTDEIGFTDPSTIGVPIKGCTVRLPLECEEVTLEGIAALQFAPVDLRGFPARTAAVRGPREPKTAFNSPRLAQQPAPDLDVDERTQLKRSLQYLRGPIETRGGVVDLPRLWAALICVYRLGPKHHIQLAVKDGQLEASEVVKRDLFAER